MNLDLKNKLINKEIIQTLKKHNTKEKFFFSSIKPNYTSYEEKRYWRGPVWINCNWIIYQGLKDKDKKFAQMVRSKTIDLVKKNGFYEYFNTMTGKAYGAKNFSWTASLFLDFSDVINLPLAQKPPSPSSFSPTFKSFLAKLATSAL